MAANTNTKNGKSNQNVQKIDAIRDIIFGQSMDDIYAKFASLESLIAKQNTQLKSTLLKLDQKIEDAVSEIKAENKKHTVESKKRLESELEGISEKLKKDVSGLSKRIILQREKLDKNIRHTQSEFTAQKKEITARVEKVAKNDNKKFVEMLRLMADQLEK